MAVIPVIPASKSKPDVKNVFNQKNGVKIDLSLLSKLEYALLEHQGVEINYNLISKLSDIVAQHNGDKISSGLISKLVEFLEKNQGAKVNFDLIAQLNDIVAQYQEGSSTDYSLNNAALSNAKMDAVNFDKKLNDKNTPAMNYNFVNQDLNKGGILECNSYFPDVGSRIFNREGGDLFKICGNRIIEHVIDDKMSNLLNNTIDGNLYAKLHSNISDVDKDEIVRILLNKKYRTSYILHFVTEDIVDKIKNDKEYFEFINSCSPGVHGAVLVDLGGYIFSHFSINCEITNVLFEKTCNLKGIVYNNGSANYALDNLKCKENIIGNSCINLNSLKSLSYEDNFQMKNNKYISNGDIDLKVKLDFASVLINLTSILLLLLSAIILFSIAVCQAYKSCKNLIGGNKNKNLIDGNKKNNIMYDNIDAIKDGGGTTKNYGAITKNYGSTTDTSRGEVNNAYQGDFLFNDVTPVNDNSIAPATK